MGSGKRLEYLDFCKLFAMFMVTMAHCAQRLSGEVFPSLLVSKDSFISINMAIFMTASGIVMNIDKMKTSGTKDFILSKAVRLLLPMTSWYLVICLITRNLALALYWDYYWYLSALFVCLVTFKLISNYATNTYVVFILSLLVLSLAPLQFLERSCYMIPFLWLGFFLRRIIHRIDWKLILVLTLLYAVLYKYWDVEYSIYKTPFHSWEVSSHMIIASVFRFAIGAVGSVAFIACSRLLIRYKYFGWMKLLASYGGYTLGFYTMSFVFNEILKRLMWHLDTYIVAPGVLDILAFVVSGLMMVIMHYIQKVLKQNRLMALFLLGNH